MKFSKNLKFTILLPAAVLVIGLIVGIICGGMNLGIDFTGGTMMTIAMHQDFDSSVVTKAFVDEGFSEKDISLTVSGSGEEAEALVRFPDTNDADRENEIRADVEKTIQATYPNAEVASTDRVGAVAGRDLVMNAISSAPVFQGTTVTLQPAAFSERTIFSFMPQSMATTLNCGLAVLAYQRLQQLTRATASCGTGVDRMRSRACSVGVSGAVMSTRREPRSRMLRVSFRVSMPEMAGMPFSSSSSESVRV